MLSRSVRVKAVIFLVISVLGVSYTAYRYAGLERLFGAAGYRVTIQLADSGGIFPNAAVTYRGVTVGTVEKLRLTSVGTAAELRINEDAPPIPAGAEAVVTNRSVIGEQYVDLRPTHSGGPYLEDGSVIARSKTAVPPRIESVLLNLDQLLDSVPRDALRTVIDELGTATHGSGATIRAIIDDSSALLRAAADNLPATKDLIAQSRAALQTQIDEADNIRTFAAGLRDLGSQLKRSDPDLRRLITDGHGAARQLGAFINESGPGLSVLVANLLTTSNVVVRRTDGLEQILVGYPVLMGISPTVLPGDGTAHLGMIFNAFDPPPCTKGYEGTKLRPGSDTNTQPYNAEVYCAEPPGSPISVRGAQNAPQGGR
jgi:phospholipid/cholesterol/gamma-HCH transport system substrate-binding protein